MERVSGDLLAEWTAEARERWHVPGMATGLLQNGETVFAADGVLELGRDEPVSPGTHFRIASVTKPFVCTLAMTLVQDGLLSLDEPPPGARTEATVCQLLSHQGGLAIEWPGDVDDAVDDAALLRLAEREPELLPVGPGELFSYCNTGYWFVGAAIARLTGGTFEEAMGQRVLEPLGLRATSFEAGPAATGHDQVAPGADEHRISEGPYPRVRRPSGGLWSTVGDLLRFGAHHLGGPGPLTADSIAEMQRQLISVPGGAYGLGWFLFRGAVEHPGSAAGFQSLLLLVPDERVAFAALANSSRGQGAIRDVRERLGLGRASPAGAVLADELLERLVGRYEGQGQRITVARDGAALRLEVAEVDPFTGTELVFPPMWAKAVAEREFEITTGEWRGERLDFPRDGFIRAMTLASRVE